MFMLGPSVTVAVPVNVFPTIAMFRADEPMSARVIVRPSKRRLLAPLRDRLMLAATPGSARIVTVPAFWPPENEP